jgi:hypothetical protein
MPGHTAKNIINTLSITCLHTPYAGLFLPLYPQAAKHRLPLLLLRQNGTTAAVAKSQLTCWQKQLFFFYLLKGFRS